MAYRYSAHNLLQEPNTYMYPPFEGGRFLNEYFSSRLEKLACLDADSGLAGSALVHSAGAIIKDWVDAHASASARSKWTLYCSLPATVLADSEQVPLVSLSSIDSEPTLTTLTLLRALIAEQLQGLLTKTGEGIWRKAVQRFEVTKRLYEFYGPDLKKGHGGYIDLQPYALLSLSCALRYTATGSLTALSAQLKLNDILCSQPINQLNTLPVGAFKLLVCSEIIFIDELIRRKEIDLGSI